MAAESLAATLDQRRLSSVLAEDSASVAALEILSGVADQLCLLHAQGFVHRAIGVDTVLVEMSSGSVSLVQRESVVRFGGSQIDPDRTPPPLRRPTSIAVGDTIAEARAALELAGISYAPEQIDIYQFGTLTCRLLAGESITDYLRSPRTKGKVPPGLQVLIERSLAHNPGDCFQSASEVRSAIGELQSEPQIMPGAVSGSEAAVASSSTTACMVAGDAKSDTALAGAVDRVENGDGAGLPFARLGHYELVARIGHGGMGDVYQGYERALDRTVAIKVLPAELAREPDFVRRFCAEASAAARVVHPNIIPIHYIGEDQGHHFFAMQYVEGESLAALLARCGKLAVDETLDLLEQVLSGLGAAHQQALIHRDIKPGNILLDRRHKRVLLADFGLVKSLREADGGKTATGVVMGTVDYIAPEQGRGLAVDHRSDLYSLGVVLYQVLSGRLPFEANSPTALIFQHVYERPRPLTEAAPEVPASLAAVVAKLMAKAPEDRHASAEAVRADLQAVREGRSLPSGADTALVRDPGVYGRPVTGGPPRTLIIEAPQFTEEPWLPADLPQAAPQGWWPRLRARLADFAQAHAPELVQRLANTQQQVDGAVAEYQRRRDRLQALVTEGEQVLGELQEQVAAWRDDSRPGDTAVRTVDELQQAITAQDEQLATMRLRLAKVNATLERLRSQRDLLNARLLAARAQRQIAETTGWRRSHLIGIAGVAAVTMAVVTWGLRAWNRTGRDVPSPRPESATKSGVTPVPEMVVPAVPGTALLVTDVVDTPLFETPGRESHVVALRCSDDGRFVAVAAENGAVDFWNPASGQLLATLATGVSGSAPIVLSGDGRVIAATMGEGPAALNRLQSWSVQSGNTAETFADVVLPVTHLALSSNDSLLYAVTADGEASQLVRWDLNTRRELGRTPLPDADIAAISVHADGAWFGTATRGGAIRIGHNGTSGADVAFFPVGAAANVVCFHPIQPVLAAGSEDGSVVLWDCIGQRPVLDLKSRDRPVRALTFDARGRRLAVAAGDHVRVWDLSLGYVRQLLTVPDAAAVAFNADGTNLVTCGGTHGVRMWDTNFPALDVDAEGWWDNLQVAREESGVENGRSNLPVAAQYEPRRARTADGRLQVVSVDSSKASSTVSKGTFLQDARSGEIIHYFYDKGALSVAISPDARSAATGSFDRETGMGDVRAWDLRSGRETRRFLGHVHFAWSVAFSPDGQRLLSGGRSTMHLWDVATGDELHRFDVPMAFVRRVTFSPDGRWAIASNEVKSDARNLEHVVFDLESGAPLLKFKELYAEIVFAPPDVLCDTRFGTFQRYDGPGPDRSGVPVVP